MPTRHTFTADTEDALWQQVAADLRQDANPFEYTAELVQAGHVIHFSLDIDLGGGFESGFATTTFSAPVPPLALRFALHEQDWLHELGKLLGLTDVELGDAELDAAFIIKTNDAAALRQLLLTTPDVRSTLLRYPAGRLTLAPAAPDEAATPLLLTFTIDEALTEPAQLRGVYHLLYQLLQQLAPVPAAAPS